MNKNVKGAIVVGIVGILGFIAYKKLGKKDSVKIVAKYLDTTYGGDHYLSVKKMYQDNNGYVDNWAKAIQDGSATFQFNDKLFWTQGGKLKN